MAVYEHTYRRYAGPLTAPWSRFLIIPRHYYNDAFKSKLFTTFFVACFAWPLVCAIFVYLHHNATALAAFGAQLADLVPVDVWFFRMFVLVQGVFAFFLNLFLGPSLVSRDMSNNALSLYLSRPFSRAEYVLGKMSVLLFLLSAITWVPGLLIFAFQGYLEGFAWIGGNAYIAAAIFFGNLVWILILSLLALAISAWVRWSLAAAAGLMALYFIPSVMSTIINALFQTRWANIINVGACVRTLWAALFHLPSQMELPLWAACATLVAVAAVCLMLLSTKVRAYEVIK